MADKEVQSAERLAQLRADLADKQAQIADMQQQLAEATAAGYLGDPGAKKRASAITGKLEAAQAEASALVGALPIVERQVLVDELSGIHQQIEANRLEMQTLETERESAHAKWIAALNEVETCERAHNELLGRIHDLRFDSERLGERVQDIKCLLAPPRPPVDLNRTLMGVGSQPGRAAHVSLQNAS
jgi:DNA repair exonuclease SbcCD ATPase subunit